MLCRDVKCLAPPCSLCAQQLLQVNVVGRKNLLYRSRLLAKHLCVGTNVFQGGLSVTRRPTCRLSWLAAACSIPEDYLGGSPLAAFPRDEVLHGLAIAVGEYAALGDGSRQASTPTPPVQGAAVDAASLSLPGREILSMLPFTSSPCLSLVVSLKQSLHMHPNSCQFAARMSATLANHSVMLQRHLVVKASRTGFFVFRCQPA